MRWRLLSVLAVLTLAAAARSSAVFVGSLYYECECLSHSSPAHEATYAANGTVQVALGAGSHAWEPWYDGSCGSLCRDLYAAPDEVGAVFFASCYPNPVTGVVRGDIVGGGCNNVSGPRIAEVIPPTEVELVWQNFGSTWFRTATSGPRTTSPAPIGACSSTRTQRVS